MALQPVPVEDIPENLVPVPASDIPQGLTPVSAADLPTKLGGAKKTLSQTLKDAGEGLVSFAGGLFKGLGESGLVDVGLQKAVPASTRLISNVIGKKPEEIKTLEQSVIKRMQAHPFSEYARGSQVGGDPESRLAKGVETGLTVAEMATAIPGLIKGGLKIAGKKGLEKSISSGKVTEKAIRKGGGGKILDMIKEGELTSDKMAALKRSGITEPSKLSKWRYGTKKLVKPSQKTLDAVATIKTEIKGAANTPQTLYNQVGDKISEFGENLGSQLDNIKIGSQTGKLRILKDKIKVLVDETVDYSRPTAKAIKQTLTEIDKAKTAKEARDVAKKMDLVIPQSIKEGASKGGKDALIYGKWRDARNAYNDFIDDAANAVDDVNVRGMFKKMTNLYRAKGGLEDNIVQITKPIRGAKQKIGSGLKKVGIGIGGALLLKGLIGGGKGGSPQEYVTE